MKGLWHAAALLVGCAIGLTAGCDTLPMKSGTTGACNTGTCATGSCATGNCGTGACGAGGGCGANGAGRCDLYDRCWPDRYTNLAQRSVNHSFAPQVLNGHVLDQT